MKKFLKKTGIGALVLALEIVATTSLLSLFTMFLWALALRGMGYC